MVAPQALRSVLQFPTWGVRKHAQKRMAYAKLMA
jgi:hypothetical protein